MAHIQSTTSDPPQPLGGGVRCFFPVCLTADPPNLTLDQLAIDGAETGLRQKENYFGSSYFSVTSPSPSILPKAVLPGGTN